MNVALFSIVVLPFAAGASFYLGGPVLGTLWIGVALLTGIIIYSALSRAKP